MQKLIRFGALEQVRRELNFVKSLMLEYHDLEAEVPEERINEIYTRNLADLAKPAGQMDERSRARQMAIQAYRETCPSNHITDCCDVCDCCSLSGLCRKVRRTHEWRDLIIIFSLLDSKRGPQSKYSKDLFSVRLFLYTGLSSPPPPSMISSLLNLRLQIVSFYCRFSSQGEGVFNF